jgi:hypothetical protein
MYSAKLAESCREKHYKTMFARDRTRHSFVQPTLDEGVQWNSKKEQWNFESPFAEASLRRMRIRVDRIDVKRLGAATLGLLLLVVATATVAGGNGQIVRNRRHEDAKLRDATLLLAKCAGLSSADEVNMLLEALEDGTLDYDVVSSALDSDARGETSKMKLATEKKATEMAPGRKTAAGRAVAATAERAAAERTPAVKIAGLAGMLFKESKHTSQAQVHADGIFGEEDVKDSFWIDLEDDDVERFSSSLEEELTPGTVRSEDFGGLAISHDEFTIRKKGSTRDRLDRQRPPISYRRPFLLKK